MNEIPWIDDPAEVPAEVADHHRDLSEADWRFREGALARPELLRRESFPGVGEPLPLLRALPCHDWPTFVRRERMEELGRITRDLVRLVKAVPERIFDNDPRRLAEYYGRFHPSILEILLAEPNGIGPGLSRTDFLWTAEDFKCLEVNLSANCGGWDTLVLRDRYLAVPAIAEWVEAQGLTLHFRDPLAILFEHVLDTVAELDGEVDVAFVVPPGTSLDDWSDATAFLADGYRRVQERRGTGGRSVVCTLDRLEVRRATVGLDGRRVHAVVGLYRDLPRPDLYRAFKAGRVALFNGPLEPILTDKRNLALLSEHAGSDRFDAAERQVIERHVPWSRVVREGVTTYQGDEIDLVPFLAAERRRFVLKPALGQGGQGVVLGSYVGGDEWRAVLDEALSSGEWLAQETLVSRAYLERWGADDEHPGACLQERVWGPFLCGDRFAGALLRQQPLTTGKPINASLGLATLSTALEVESTGS